MQQFTRHYNKLQTPQSQPIPGEDQVENSAGGYVYEVDKWQRLRRFLILGTEGGTYYIGEPKLTRENARCVEACLDEDPTRTVNEIVSVSFEGRAPKNDPAIFALALAASHPDKETRRHALMKLNNVCRIPTHLFHFLEYCKGLRGWGRGLRSAVQNWYNNTPVDKLAYQAVKYQQRDGWSHRDVLRKAHPKGDEKHDALYGYMANKDGAYLVSHLPPIVGAFERTKTADRKETISLIREHGLTREMIQTEHLKHADVWEALLEKMPLTAMIRNLGNMSKVGLLTETSRASKLVAEKLRDTEHMRKSRVHPLAVLTALRIYKQGHGLKGKGEWIPIEKINDAMDDAFYASFGNVESTGKNIMLALDVSGSMSWGQIAGSPLTPREASACMAMVTARTEPEHFFVAFCDRMTPVSISPKARLLDVVQQLEGLPFGGTDCSLPMKYAQRRALEVDAICIYTDSETWAGTPHPSQALRQYRKASGRDTKLVVVGMTANKFTIADPKDPGMLDVVGFDLATPQVISEMVRG